MNPRKKKSLSGVSKVVADDPYKIIVAMNGSKIKDCKVSDGMVTYQELAQDLVEITIKSPKNAEIRWTMQASN